MITILGTGQIGSELYNKITRDYKNVHKYIISKSGKVKFLLDDHTKVIALDVTRPDSLIEIFQNSKIVFNCTDVPYQDWGSFYPKLTIAIINGLKKSNAKMVFADNMYSYGNLKGSVITEILPHSAETNKGKIRAQVINDFIENGVFDRVAMVKASDFIGPNIHKGIFGNDFLKNVYNNKSVYLFGNSNVPHTYTYISDFAEALLKIANADDTFGQVWHVPNATPISNREWVKLFEKETGKEIKVSIASKPILRIIGLFNKLVNELLELAYQFDYAYLISHEKFEKRFGNIATSHQEIVKETVDRFNKNK